MNKPTMSVSPNGHKEWHLNGDLHRTDGPAIEYASGTRRWFLNGKCHRTDGPAVEWANGDKEWWLNDKRHRTDGPAVEYPDGTKFWYINGEKLTEGEFDERMNKPTMNVSPQFIIIDNKKYKLTLMED